MDATRNRKSAKSRNKAAVGSLALVLSLCFAAPAFAQAAQTENPPLRPAVADEAAPPADAAPEGDIIVTGSRLVLHDVVGRYFRVGSRFEF